MTNLYIIRHGESVANVEGRYQGQTYDTDLSQLGIKQSQAVAEELSLENIEQIICSPLKRTLQTAQIIGKHLDLSIQTDARIIEINHGGWEGLKKTEIARKFPEPYRLWQTVPASVQMPNGENSGQVLERALLFINSIENSDKNIALITHDLVIRVLIMHWQQKDLNRVWEIALDNCGISKVALGNNIKIKIEYINKNLHLVKLKGNIKEQAL